LAAPISGVFVAGGVALISTWALANKLHPRIGQARIAIESPIVTANESGFQITAPGEAT
jgi:ACDE family multidrug resistance protein